MKRTIMIIVLTVFAVLLVEFLAVEIYFRTHKFSAKEKPSWLERAFAEHARNISTPSDAKSLTNPRPITEESMKEAREHFVEHCSMCHGVDGKGQSTIGQNLYPQAPDMTQGATQQKSDGELFYIISNGVRFTGMPAWEGADTPEAIWDLVSFIRRLPQLTPEELKELKQIAGEEDMEEVKEGHEQMGGMAEQKVEGEKGQGNTNRAAPPMTRPKKKPHTHAPGTKPHNDH